MALALHRSIEREMRGAFVEMAEVRCWMNPNSGNEIDFVGSRLGLEFESKYVDAGWRGASRAIAAQGAGGVCGDPPRARDRRGHARRAVRSARMAARVLGV